MLRAIATFIARWQYVWKQEREGGLNEWSALVAEQKAKETHNLITALTAEADNMEARIKQMAEMEAKGFWTCENGHEMEADDKTPLPTPLCAVCDASTKYIKRDLMTGQEKYESDKDRHDAEKLLAEKREGITEKETEAIQQESLAKYFRQQSEASRRLAESVRNL